MKNYVLLIALVSSVASITRAADRHEIAARIAAAHTRTAATEAERAAAEERARQQAYRTRHRSITGIRYATPPQPSRAHELSSTQHALHTLVVDSTFNQFKEEDAVRAQKNRTPKTAMQAIAQGNTRQARSVIKKLEAKALSDNGHSEDARTALKILRNIKNTDTYSTLKRQAADEALHTIELQWAKSREYEEHCFAAYKHTVQPLMNNIHTIATQESKKEERGTLVNTLISLYEQGSNKAKFTLHYLAEAPYRKLRRRVKKAVQAIKDPSKKEEFLTEVNTRREQRAAERKYHVQLQEKVAWATQHVRKKAHAIRAARAAKEAQDFEAIQPIPRDEIIPRAASATPPSPIKKGRARGNTDIVDARPAKKKRPAEGSDKRPAKRHKEIDGQSPAEAVPDSLPLSQDSTFNDADIAGSTIHNTGTFEDMFGNFFDDRA